MMRVLRLHLFARGATAVLFCVSIAILCVGWAVKGTFVGLDTQGYLASGVKYMDWLLAGLPESDVIGKLFIVPHYVISTVVITGVYHYLNAGAFGVVAVNCVLYSLIVCMVFHIWHCVSGIWEGGRSISQAALIAIGGMYIIFGLPDAPLWTYGVLTEIIFLFWVAAFIFFSAMALLRGSWLAWILALLFAVTAPFVRPTGIILPILYLFALCLDRFPILDRRFALLAIASLVLPVLATFVVVPILVLLQINQDPLFDALVPDVIARRFAHAANFFAKQWVVADRLQWDVTPVLTYLDIVKMMLYRIAFYLVPLRWGAIPYSFVHNAVNLIYMVIALPLFAFGVRSAFTRAGSTRLLALFLVMVAYLYMLLHAATLVSYDWRYQLPAMIPLWIFAGLGYMRLLGYGVRSG